MLQLWACSDLVNINIVIIEDKMIATQNWERAGFIICEHVFWLLYAWPIAQNGSRGLIM